MHYGRIVDGDRIVDDVVIALYKNPRSYTGENVVEISCHGSDYIVQEIMKLCTTEGARLAKPGEFTMRAFMNGRLDLSQAEAVADLIASEDHASHQLAIDQLRGGISKEIQSLRSRLVKFASLIELENDFAEEDVEFANRQELVNTVSAALKHIKELMDSFAYGNAIKKGVAVAIVGKPNVGKSTLLNALLK